MGGEQSKAAPVPEYAREVEAASYEQLTEQVSVIARLFASTAKHTSNSASIFLPLFK